MHNLLRPALLVLALPVRATQLASIPEDLDFDFECWPYPLHQEVTDRLHELAELHPRGDRRGPVGWRYGGHCGFQSAPPVRGATTPQ